MNRREREFRLRKREVLEAALRLFSRKGYAGTSMKEIAKESEFAVGTIYKFFPTKRDLYCELVLERARDIHQGLMSVFEQPDAISLLKRVLELKWHVVQKNRDFLRVYYSELWETRFGVQGTLTGEVKKMYDEYFEKLVAVFERGIKEGLFKKGSPRLYALAFEGIVNNVLLASLEEGDLKVLPTEVLDVFLKTILMEEEL